MAIVPWSEESNDARFEPEAIKQKQPRNTILGFIILEFDRLDDFSYLLFRCRFVNRFSIIPLFVVQLLTVFDYFITQRL